MSNPHHEAGRLRSKPRAVPGLETSTVTAVTDRTVATSRNSDSGRITICLFTSTTCAPCRKLETTTLRTLNKRGWKIADFDSGQSANIHRLDFDKHRVYADRWKVDTVPTWIVFRGSKPVRTVSGVLSAEEVARLWNDAEQTDNAAVPEKRAR